MELAGTDFLCELLDSLSTIPAQNAGQVLERYRDHPHAPHLEKLAAREMLISDRSALERQLKGVLERLIGEQLHRKRFESLGRRRRGITAEGRFLINQ